MSKIGQSILHYNIIKKLGEGGMGVVYLAEDTKLERKVAIKFLPSNISENSEERKRFTVEAKASASLNHPNIAHIYAIEEANNEVFIVMEYVDGVELKNKIESGSISANEAVNIAVSIAEGLDAAHKKGIIHRDIKSQNIMISQDGKVKIMDFGLAKIKGGTLLTKTGTTVGTAAYMSPEQARGGEVDQQSDIWSLGIVLYEMLTGKLPFNSDYDQAIIYSILNEEPPFIELSNLNIPEDLIRILHQLLEKNTDSRYQSDELLIKDLNSLYLEDPQYSLPGHYKSKSPGTKNSKFFRPKIIVPLLFIIIGISIAGYFFMNRGNPDIDSIAVLPFINDNGDSDVQYLTDGITENLINNLTQIPSLRVVPRNTVFTFKGRINDPQEIGTKLNVRAVVTGRVLQHGDNINIQADLIDVKRQAELWGEQYNEKMTNLLGLQQQIAGDISKELRTHFTGEKKIQFKKTYTDNSIVYQLYLKGRYYWNQRKSGPAKAIEYFNQAIEKDSNYAPAYVGLADCYLVSAQWESGNLVPAEADPLGKMAIEKALLIDDSLAEAHASLGFYYLNYEWDWANSEKEFKTALELNPNYPTTYHWYSHFLTAMGRNEESLKEAKKALSLDPLDDVLNAHLGWAYIFAREYDNSILQCKKILEFKSDNPTAHFFLGWAYQEKGMLTESIGEFQKTLSINPNATYATAAMGYTYALLNKPEESKKMYTQLLNSSRNKYVDAYNFAIIYIGLGNKDKAFEFLNKAYKEHSNWIAYLKVEPRLDAIRSDPRFIELLVKTGLQ